MSNNPESENVTSLPNEYTASIDQVADQVFDYIIVGGGTSGLTLAARLSEDPNLTVAVLEAGGENINNPYILAPATFGRNFSNPELAWAHASAPQKFSKDRVYPWHRGRGLGGSSGLNFMVWSKPPRFDIDVWETLGSKGWNWENYHKYTKKAEGFVPPSPEQVERDHFTYDINNHGTSGPLTTGFSPQLFGGELVFHETINNLGFKSINDAAGGEVTGASSFAHTIDPSNTTRSYATTAYFLPNAKRPNLRVITNATATKIITKDDGSGLEATGVEFTYHGSSRTVRTKREVILSAGTLRSSSLLELSGIGDKNILEPLGITTKVHNPGVGENLQEHLLLGTVFEYNDKYTYQTIDSLADPEVAAAHLALHTKNEGLFRMGLTTFAFLPLSEISDRGTALLAQQEKKVDNLVNDGYFESRPGLLEQYKAQLEAYKREDLPDCEFIYGPMYFGSVGAPEKGRTYGSIVTGLNHPYSRGSIHIKSADPTIDPLFDPRVFEHDFDVQVLVESVKFARRVADTEPFKEMTAREVVPGPNFKTDEEITEFVKETAVTMWHTAGSCAMRPRDKGGVVDAELKVYGTKNIRVGDISILPLHIMAHPQATSYAIGEQLADIIKGNL